MKRVALYSKDGIYTRLGLVGCSTNSRIIPQNPAGGPSLPHELLLIMDYAAVSSVYSQLRASKVPSMLMHL